MNLTTRYNQNIEAIKTLKSVAESKSQPTEAQRETMALYSGWGGFSSFFKEGEHINELDALRELVTSEEFDSIYQSILDAYYTPKAITDTIYSILKANGLKDGDKVLDPCSGLMAMSKPFIENHCVDAIEIDPITYQIAHHTVAQGLNSHTNKGFEKYECAESTYASVIANPPYGSHKLFDPMSASRSKLNIHNYFIAKSLDLVACGGVVAMVVTSSFLNNDVPLEIQMKAKLIAAYRLPESAFSDTNTGIITDIVILKKRSQEEISNYIKDNQVEIEGDFCSVYDSSVSKLGGAYSSIEVSNYFLANPQNILGEQGAKGSRYGLIETVEGDLNEAISTIKNANLTFEIAPNYDVDLIDDGLVSGESLDIDPDNAPEAFSMIRHEKLGHYVQRITGEKYALLPSIKIGSVKEKRLLAGISLSCKLAELQAMENSTELPAIIEAARAELVSAYKFFTSKYGAINSSTNRFLMDDNRLLPIFGLEADYKPKISEKQAEKRSCEAQEESWKQATILKERIYFPVAKQETAPTPKQARTLTI